MRNAMRPLSPEAVATEITRYLAAHPHAADTAEGIMNSWLQRETMAAADKKCFVHVLEQLVADGVMTKRQSADGAIVYCRAHTAS